MKDSLAHDLSEAAKRIFVSGSPYDPTFATDSIARTLLAPTSGSMLDRAQFDAVGRAHAAGGGGPVYVVPLSDFGLEFDSQRDSGAAFADDFRSLGKGRPGAAPVWAESGLYPIDFGDPTTYYSEEYRAYMSIESIFVPASGAWGVLVAEDDFAVAAGSPRFIEHLLAYVGHQIEEMARTFIRQQGEWAGSVLPVGWSLRLLETIYGPTEADRLTRLGCGEDPEAEPPK